MKKTNGLLDGFHVACPGVAVDFDVFFDTKRFELFKIRVELFERTSADDELGGFGGDVVVDNSVQLSGALVILCREIYTRQDEAGKIVDQSFRLHGAPMTGVVGVSNDFGYRRVNCLSDQFVGYGDDVRIIFETGGETGTAAIVIETSGALV